MSANVCVCVCVCVCVQRVYVCRDIAKRSGQDNGVSGANTSKEAEPADRESGKTDSKAVAEKDKGKAKDALEGGSAAGKESGASKAPQSAKASDKADDPKGNADKTAASIAPSEERGKSEEQEKSMKKEPVPEFEKTSKSVKETRHEPKNTSARGAPRQSTGGERDKDKGAPENLGLMWPRICKKERERETRFALE